MTVAKVIIAAFAVFYLGTGQAGAEEHRAEFPHMTIEAVVSRAAPDADGALEVGLLFRLEKGWHIYWKNPGDSGLPTHIDWSSSGASFSETRYPPPQRIPYGDMMNYGYEEEALLWSTVHRNDSDWSAAISAKARWALCKDECIPGSAQIVVGIGEGEGARAAVRPALFAKYTALLSNPERSATAEADNESILIELPASMVPAESRSGVFVPEKPRIILNSGPQPSRRTSDGGLEIVVPLKRNATLPDPLRGLVLFGDAGPEAALAVRVTVVPRAAGFEIPIGIAVALLLCGSVIVLRRRSRMQRSRKSEGEACVVES